MAQPVLSLFVPLTPRNSTCGYCGPPGERSAGRTSYHAAEGIAYRLSCQVRPCLPVRRAGVSAGPDR